GAVHVSQAGGGGGEAEQSTELERRLAAGALGAIGDGGEEIAGLLEELARLLRRQHILRGRVDDVGAGAPAAPSAAEVNAGGVMGRERAAGAAAVVLGGESEEIVGAAGEDAVPSGVTASGGVLGEGLIDLQGDVLLPSRPAEVRGDDDEQDAEDPGRVLLEPLDEIGVEAGFLEAGADLDLFLALVHGSS